MVATELAVPLYGYCFTVQVPACHFFIITIITILVMCIGYTCEYGCFNTVNTSHGNLYTQVFCRLWCLSNYLGAQITTHLFLLPITPDPSHRLIVIGWIPVRVKHNQSACSNEIEATPTSLAAQHEHKVLSLTIKRHTSYNICFYAMHKYNLEQHRATFYNIL